ncbi:hypothetical protein [Brachybacterium saurashtrense]|uniref:hypothetical protein n=1 Tax=Brachybacterium saurashtrense TaxID=556288 RepID=UPI0019D2C144
MLNATFTAPDLDTFSQLDRLGLTVTGQLIEPHRSVLECRVLEPDNWCHGCGQQGVLTWLTSSAVRLARGCDLG